MNWWWFGLSLVGGVVVVLADLYRHQSKRGLPWLGEKPLLSLAANVLVGSVGGWLAFYYSPPVIYNGVMALIDLFGGLRR